MLLNGHKSIKFIKTQRYRGRYLSIFLLNEHNRQRWAKLRLYYYKINGSEWNFLLLQISKISWNCLFTPPPFWQGWDSWMSSQKIYLCLFQKCYRISAYALLLQSRLFCTQTIRGLFYIIIWLQAPASGNLVVKSARHPKFPLTFSCPESFINQFRFLKTFFKYIID